MSTVCIWMQGVYTPSIIDNGTIQAYRSGVGNTTGAMYTNLNTTLYSFRQASSANELTRLTAADWTALNTTIAQAARNNSNLINPRVSQTGMTCYTPYCAPSAQ